MNFNPLNTRALVVGVERYGFGNGWDLPGPVADAHRFIAWLHGRGVPAANITAFLAQPVRPPPADQPALPVGVVRRKATHQEIIAGLTNELVGAPPDVLWLWWGGHGVVQQDVGRALFFEDSSDAYRQTLDLGEFLSFVRFAAAGHPGALQRIIAVIDACSTHAHLLGMPGQLPHDAFGSGDPVSGRECSLLCASQTGQAAKNFAVEQTGLFSREILPRLAATPVRVWPPDMGEVARDLRQRFLALNRDGKTNQLPAYYAYETPCGHEPALRFNRPVTLTLTEKIRLRDALLECETIDDRDRRPRVIRQLPKHVRNNINSHPAANFDVLALVEACLKQPGGFTALIEALRVLDPSSETEGFAALAVNLGVFSDSPP